MRKTFPTITDNISNSFVVLSLILESTLISSNRIVDVPLGRSLEVEVIHMIISVYVRVSNNTNNRVAILEFRPQIW